jgi:MFS superfamily sulfate permease-like transporter
MELPGVLVTLFATPLWYANASHFRDEIEAAIAEHLPELRLVVLDVVGMSDLDFTGAATLRQVVEELHAKGVAFAIARSGQRVRAGLERSGLTELIGEDHLFPSVDLAVLAADLSN